MCVHILRTFETKRRMNGTGRLQSMLTSKPTGRNPGTGRDDMPPNERFCRKTEQERVILLMWQSQPAWFHGNGTPTGRNPGTSSQWVRDKPWPMYLVANVEVIRCCRVPVRTPRDYTCPLRCAWCQRRRQPGRSTVRIGQRDYAAQAEIQSYTCVDWRRIGEVYRRHTSDGGLHR